MTKPTHWNESDGSKRNLLLTKAPSKGGPDTNDTSKGNVETICQTHFPHVFIKNSTTMLGLSRYLLISTKKYQDHLELHQNYELFIIN